MAIKREVVLASTSPRRLFLLEGTFLKIEVKKPQADETLSKGDIKNSVIKIARKKYDSIAPSDKPVISADTIVKIDDQIFTKPCDKNDAINMLKRLSGKKHEVITGFCVGKNNTPYQDAVVSKIWFRDLSIQEIENYILKEEYSDKAGAYGIQGFGGTLIDRIEGSYTNIMGLPLKEVLDTLKKIS